MLIKTKFRFRAKKINPIKLNLNLLSVIIDFIIYFYYILNIIYNISMKSINKTGTKGLNYYGICL